jgi:hypothetical protein
VLTQPNARAICFWDSVVHQLHATTAIVKGTEAIDKMEIALEHGGSGIVANTLEEIGRFAVAQRFNGAQLCSSIDDYDEKSRGGWETRASRSS